MSIYFNPQFNDEIRCLITSYPKHYMRMLLSSAKKKHQVSRKYLVDYIYQCTSFLSNFYTLKTRIWWLINNVQNWNDKRVRCTICNNPITNYNISKITNPYRSTCSVICKRKLATENTKEHLRKEYGIENVFQRKDVKEKIAAQSDEIYSTIHKLKQERYGDPYFNNTTKAQKTKLKKYGSVFNLSKCKETWKEKFGVENPMQCLEVRQKQQLAQYIYDGIKFDSSWEVAYYIWLVDSNIEFVYQPDEPKLWYQKNDGSWHRYFPDFLLTKTNQLIEIKGNNAFDDIGNPIKNGTLDWSEKFQCMLDNNVKMMMKDDVQQYIDYVNDKYGKEFIASCKI